MASNVKGYEALQARMKAIGGTNPAFMRLLGLSAVREQKLIVRRKTGNLGRSIVLGAVTPKTVTTEARANYAAFVEFGTRPHEISPRAAKALRWAAPGGARLTGSPRKGAGVIFARRVHHPGTRAYPFMVPGAQKAVEQSGADAVVRAWNEAS